MKIYTRGCLLNREGKVFPADSSNAIGGSRGLVTSFSYSSRLRLRKWLLTKCVVGANIYGVTLTIPECADKSNICELFRRSFHRFRMSFIRRFPRSAFVWRVELQVSRMPHLHLVSYHDSIVSSSDYLSIWYSSIIPDFSIPSLSAFSMHGVLVSPLDGSINAYRYVCDHGSKSKQAQLGWVGRQWGIIGRSFFKDCSFTSVDLPEYLESKFNRFLSKINSFRISAPCVFGSKLVRRRRKFSVAYVSDNSILRWLNYHGVSIKRS